MPIQQIASSDSHRNACFGIGALLRLTTPVFLTWKHKHTHTHSVHLSLLCGGLCQCSDVVHNVIFFWHSLMFGQVCLCSLALHYTSDICPSVSLSAEASYIDVLGMCFFVLTANMFMCVWNQAIVITTRVQDKLFHPQTIWLVNAHISPALSKLPLCCLRFIFFIYILFWGMKQIHLIHFTSVWLVAVSLFTFSCLSIHDILCNKNNVCSTKITLLFPLL